MSLSNKFTFNLPKLDLHGEIKETAILLTNDFIKENFKLKNEYFVIIHGRGNGILKNAVHDTLKHNKNVIEYQLDFYNIGSTIVRIKI